MNLFHRISADDLFRGPRSIQKKVNFSKLVLVVDINLDQKSKNRGGNLLNREACAQITSDNRGQKWVKGKEKTREER